MPPVVIGLTGASRCGKSWVAKDLAEAFSLPHGCIVGQDSYWKRSMRVRLPDGRDVMSDEEPACVDNGKFVDAVERAITTATGQGQKVVIVDGFQLLHDPLIPPLLHQIWLLDLDEHECIQRRSAPRGPLNRHPMSRKQCKELLWPAHERYLQQSVAPLEAQGRILKVAAPSNKAEVADIVQRICDQVNAPTPQLQEERTVSQCTLCALLPQSLH